MANERLWRMWYQTPLAENAMKLTGATAPKTGFTLEDPRTSYTGDRDVTVADLINGAKMAGRKGRKPASIHERLFQNDKLLYSLMVSNRDWAANHRHPEVYSESSKYAGDGVTLTPQSSLYRLRSAALCLTRDELAAYVGCTKMTVYRQESIDWLTGKSYPHWPIWYAVLKWSKVRYGHIVQFIGDIRCLDLFVTLAGVPKKDYYRRVVEFDAGNRV